MIDKDQVKHVARLARLGMDEKENEKIQKEISSILDYFKVLEEADTSKTKPTFHSVEEFIDSESIMREDEAVSQPEDIADILIEAAPDKKKRYIKVKAIL